jgi:uncharacterized glyoxalase superfamily protein PhnB
MRSREAHRGHNFRRSTNHRHRAHSHGRRPAGGIEIGLNQDDWKKGRDRQKGIGVRLAITTTTAGDVDALAARAKNAGIGLTVEPHDTEWNSRAFALKDPSGYLLTVFSQG